MLPGTPTLLLQLSADWSYMLDVSKFKERVSLALKKEVCKAAMQGKGNWCRPGTSGASAHWLGHLVLGPSPLRTITWNPNALLTGFPRLPARPVLGTHALVLQLTAGPLRAVSPVALGSSLTAVFF